jgi:hypothetical protein
MKRNSFSQENRKPIDFEFEELYPEEEILLSKKNSRQI